jgi:uncharacterized phage protein (TIGR01671 family)
MREIKFRGKAFFGRWVYGSLVSDGNIATIVEKIGNFPISVDPETVGEFTGLTDKNGKEIFEGDIVEVIEADEDSCMGNEFIRVCEVCFGGGDYPSCFTVKNKAFWLDYALLYNKRAEIKVIGIIHENIELLGKP